MSFEKPLSWVSFWDQSHSIYANQRHLLVHYQMVANCILDHIESSAQVVLDYGCGDALNAAQVAQGCKHLYLFETASHKRELLRERFASAANITVLDEAGLAQLAHSSVDRVIINSVLQYLTPMQADEALVQLRAKLTSQGQVIVADVINPASGMKDDVLALLRLAWKSGFLMAAGFSLLRTVFSNYTLMRKRLGLTVYSEEDFKTLAKVSGYRAQRIHPNFGHNQARMAFRLNLDTKMPGQREV